MSRFYVPPGNFSGQIIKIQGKEAHHILDVMRMTEGDDVSVFDGTGREYYGTIRKADPVKKKLVVEITRVDTCSSEGFPRVTLAQAVPKKNRMDYIVEKATELGVEAIIPLMSKRTVVKPGERSAARKIERWRAIAVEASKQCGRSVVPEIHPITSYADAAEDLSWYDMGIIAHLAGGTLPLKQVLSEQGDFLRRIIILIGPEGDFTSEEVELARRAGCRPVSLGPRVLKSDTAGLFSVSAVNYHYS